MSIADVSLVAFLHCYVEFLMQHLILLDYKYIILC